MKPKQRIGAVILTVTIVAVLIIASGIVAPDPSDSGLTVVRGYGGALKVGFLNDPQVAGILKDRYGLQVEISAAGSIEMMCDLPLDDKDFIWAGDQSSLAIYRDCGGTAKRTDNVYNSPVVLYSWTPIVASLVEAGIAREEPGGAYSIEFEQLVTRISDGTTWADIGVDELHGNVTVHTTDPARSNSGYLFAGLLANSMNNGDVVNETAVGPLLSDIRAIFDQLGYMEATSGDLFEQFLTTGMGAKPIVAGYESQLLEFVIANPEYQDQVTQQVRILYPRPTVWASHPLVARTDNGSRLLDALQDPEIQTLAWVRHGHRSGIAGVTNDPELISVPGLMDTVTSVVDMPAPAVMNRILTAISERPQYGGTPPP